MQAARHLRVATARSFGAGEEPEDMAFTLASTGMRRTTVLLQLAGAEQPTCITFRACLSENLQGAMHAVMQNTPVASTEGVS